MPEQMPGLRALADMAGCHFAPRCPLVAEDAARSDAADVSDCARPPCGLHPRRSDCRDRGSRRERRSACTASPRSVLGRSKGLSKTMPSAGGLFRRRRNVECGQGRFFQHRRKRVCRLWSAKAAAARARSPASDRAGAADRAAASCSTATDLAPTVSAHSRSFAPQRCRWCFRIPQSALNPRRRVASIVTQAMEAGSRHATRDERLRADRGAARRDRPAAGPCRALSRTAIGRPAPARQHRARAVQRSADPGRRRDRLRPRRLGAGATPQPAAAAARRTWTSPCCSSRTISRWCAIFATACW